MSNAGAGGVARKNNVRPPFHVEQPRRNPVQVERSQQQHLARNLEEHEKNTYERALKDARIQVILAFTTPIHI